MSWLKLDDKFPGHPKIIGLSDAAFRLHLYALAHCAEYETDGRVSADFVQTLKQFSRRAETVRELVDAALWNVVDGGWLIHDYLEYNPSRAKLKAQRDAAKERMRVTRSREVPANGSAGSHEVFANVHANTGVGSHEVREHRARAHAGRAGISDPVQNNLTGGIDGRASPADKPGPEVFAPAPAAAAPLVQADRVAAIAAEISRHEVFAGLNATAVAKGYESATMTAQKPLAWVYDAIRECAAKHTGAGLNQLTLHKILAGFMMRARRPRTEDEPANAAPQTPQESADERATREQQRRDRDAVAASLARKRAGSGDDPKGGSS